MKRFKNGIWLLLGLLLLTGCGAGQNAAPETTAAMVETTLATEETTPATEPELTEQAAGIALADGVYLVDFETDSSMFHANEACDGKGTLTVSGGQMTLHVSLTSKNIVNLYVGMAEQAQQEGAVWLEPTVDTVTYSDGLSEEVNGFDIPVEAVEQEFDLALIGQKGVWYDHKVSVQNPVPQEGSYVCDVALEGGSGRATVESPAALVSDGKTITATIVWSSPNYEYMIVDGVQYDPVQEEGNSTFQIPVVLGQKMAVSASTVAMSQPHLVDYTLYLDGASLRPEGE